MPKQVTDLIVDAAWMLPIAPANVAHRDHSLAVADGRIVSLGPTDEIHARYRAKSRLTLSDHILLPGLVNAHGHLAMSLFRGLADDLPLNEWLVDHIWPLETQWVDPEFVRDGAGLAVAEMLRSGTTCCSDMYFFPEVTAEVARKAGLRAQVAFPIVRFPNAWSRDPDEAFHKGLALHDEYRDDPLIRVAFGPHAPNTVTGDDLTRTLTLADELDAPVQIHLHENQREVDDARERLGKTHIEWLDELGLLMPRLQAVHMTQVSENERELIAQAGVAVIHCPHSNLKLGSGLCDVAAFQSAGVRVGLGTDGAASNNGLDMFSEMRASALLAKALSEDATTAGAFETLRLATLGGAEAIGLDQEIGSLEAGKWADLVAVDCNSPEMVPVHRPESQLAYTASGARVSHVWVAGKALVTDRLPTTLDVDAISSRARRWIARFQMPESQLQLL